MDKRLITSLLRIIHSPEKRFAGQTVERFFKEYHIGFKSGASWVLSDRDKTEIGRILRGEAGIDPDKTTPDQWNNLSRSQALSLSHNEKLARKAVGSGRLRIKTMPGSELQVAGGRWVLPERVDIGVDVGMVLGSPIGHDALLVVENLQTFDDIHRVSPEIMRSVASSKVLVVYRGDAQSGARADAVHELVGATDLPVFAFVDFDPAGLVIAASLPRLDVVLAPDLRALEHDIQRRGICERYHTQMAALGVAVRRAERHPKTAELWHIIYRMSKALPQEFFHGAGGPLPSAYCLNQE